MRPAPSDPIALPHSIGKPGGEKPGVGIEPDSSNHRIRHQTEPGAQRPGRGMF